MPPAAHSHEKLVDFYPQRIREYVSPSQAAARPQARGPQAKGQTKTSLASVLGVDARLVGQEARRAASIAFLVEKERETHILFFFR